MSWTATDDDAVADDAPHSAANTFRFAENGAERWQVRTRMATVMFDTRDPIDVASIGYFRRVLFPAIPIPPGYTSVKLRLFFNVTDTAGVTGRWVALDTSQVIESSDFSLTSTSDAIQDVTLDLTEWSRTTRNRVLKLGLDIQSQETSASVINLTLSGVSEGFLETTAMGGVTDDLAAFSVSLKNASKTTSSEQLPGGPFQTVWNDGVEKWSIYPMLTGINPYAATVAGGFVINRVEYTSVDLQEYARLRILAVGVEFIAASSFPLSVRSDRGPIIEDGTKTQGAMRPAYPHRAKIHRTPYQETQRFWEVCPTVHSIGPQSGSNGLDVVRTPTVVRGTHTMWPSVIWTGGDTAAKSLFMCRVGDDPEYKEPGSATLRVRRSMRIHVALLFMGGLGNPMDFTLTARTYSVGGGSVVYAAPPTPIRADYWNPLVDMRRAPAWEQLLAYQLIHPDVWRNNLVANPSSDYRRCNLMGLWERGSWEVLGSRLVTTSWDIVDPDSSNADPEVLEVLLAPVTTDSIFVETSLAIGEVRCWIVGWAVEGKPDGPMEAIGV